MVKITIENSKGVDRVEGNAMFAILTGTQDTGKVGNIICADGELDKRVVAMALADLVRNSIESISESKVERNFLAMMFLKHFEKLLDERMMNEKKSENPLADLMEILGKAGI
ncbi:MAG: hypothetical protein J5979_03725 [Lachnospiraceae bacterium]|nr:hypothetical protein [Lachnospiraceae bacterium]